MQSLLYKRDQEITELKEKIKIMWDIIDCQLAIIDKLRKEIKED